MFITLPIPNFEIYLLGLMITIYIYIYAIQPNHPRSIKEMSRGYRRTNHLIQVRKLGTDRSTSD